MQALHLLRVNIFKFTVLMGTFGLAMAFAGNDLVNFIGVPLAGLDSYQDFTANAHGQTIDTFMMSSLMESATTPPLYLILAGLLLLRHWRLVAELRYGFHVKVRDIVHH